MSVRVRFAPSPTGFLHIGGVRTALFNYLFAKNKGGIFILRIEDTDVERSTDESVENLITSMKWMGLDWDEGPDAGGDHGPYFQSKRFDLYNRYIDELLKKGSAYKCFCSEGELEEQRQERIKNKLPPKYSGKCKDLSPEVIKRSEDEGIVPVIRFRVPDSGTIEINDLIHGNTVFQAENLGDFVIKRSNNYPTYNFTCVVDDIEMKISHILRGDDHLSNTPKQVLIYKALGKDTPEFGHLPMILGPDGTRLSKRHGATSVEEFKNSGFLKEALINFLALLGWSPNEKGGKPIEIMELDEIINDFDLSRVSKNPAVFNIEKLTWMNGIYLRKKSNDEIIELVPELKERELFLNRQERMNDYINATRDYYNTLSDIMNHVDDFEKWDISEELVSEYKGDVYKKMAGMLMDAFEHSDTKDMKKISEILKVISNETGLKGKDLYHPLRVIITGKENGPELVTFFSVLEKTEILKRLRSYLEFIGE